MASEESTTAAIKVEQMTEMLGISKSLLRLWEEEFGLPQRANGTVTPLQVAEIRLIHQLINEKSLTLEDAKQAFSLMRISIEKRFETIEKLKNIKEGLLILKEKI